MTQKMVGSDLIRFIRIIDTNHVESTVPATNRGNGKRVKVVLTWQRIAQTAEHNPYIPPDHRRIGGKEWEVFRLSLYPPRSKGA
jgi:hypothetical protein